MKTNKNNPKALARNSPRAIIYRNTLAGGVARNSDHIAALLVLRLVLLIRVLVIRTVRISGWWVVTCRHLL